MANVAVNLQGKDNLTKTVKEATKAVDDLKKSTTELGKAEKDFQRITNSGKSLKTQLNQLKALMADMNMKGLSDSDEFNKIAQYAGQVKDAISDASSAVDKFSSDTLNLDAATQAVQGIAAGFSVATGAMALFGTENEQVQQAILKVQAALSILNGVQAISNVLNKDSALMLKLKSIATNLNTTATTANEAATNAATASQLRLNAAILANPYVIAAASIAALTAGIVLWVRSSNDATEATEAQKMALDAFSDEAEKQTSKLAEQISVFNRLKKTYDESGGKVDILTKKIIGNKEAQRTLGVTLKTVDDVHKLFGKNSQNYVNAAVARSNAMAAEAAEAALLGQALSALSKVYAKLMKGEEVDYSDFTKALSQAGIDYQKSWEIMGKAGGKYESDIIFGNLKVEPDKVADFMKNVNKLVTEEFYKNGPGKTLTELFDKSMTDFETETIDFSDLYDQNEKGEQKVTKAKRETKKETTKTHEEIKKVLTTLEGCEAIIEEANKEMQKLDRTSKTYEQDVSRLKTVIRGAMAAKLLLIDYSTIKGLSEARNIIMDIRSELEPASEEFEEWDKQLRQINEQAYTMAETLAMKGDLASLRNVQSALDSIINSLPDGSVELEKWVKLWSDVNGKITTTNQHIEDLKKGIEEGSIAKLQQQINEIENTLLNKNLSTDVRVKLNYNKRELQMQLNELQKGELSIGVIPDLEYTQSRSFEDLEKSAENARTIISKLQTDLENGIIDKNVFKQELWGINQVLTELAIKPIIIHIKTNIEEVVEDIQDSFSHLDGLISTTDSIVALTDAINENADAWDIFKAAVQAVEGVLNGVQTVMAIVNAINEVAYQKSLKRNAALSAEAIANQAASASEKEKAVTDTASVAPSTAATVALKAQETAYLNMAAAAIYAAHAAIPFVGVATAQGLISAMMAAQAAQHAASLALASFAEGGIVGGASPIGDKMLVRVNSGEMILNGKQQRRLFDILNGGGAIGGTTNQTITWRIKGADLYGALSNYGKIKSKTGGL